MAHNIDDPSSATPGFTSSSDISYGVLTIKDIAEPEEMGSQKPKASKGHKKLKNGRRGVFVSLLDLNIINSSSMVILTPHVDE